VPAFLRTLLQKLASGWRSLLGGGGGVCLCDTCKWDYGDACRRPERPNATVCPDYKRR
jgi:hypothetical protein